MDVDGYRQQLVAICQVLKECPVGAKREELLSLKENIEELISLANENENQNQDNSVADSVDIEPENESKIDDEYALFMAELAEEGAIQHKNENSSHQSSNSECSLQLAPVNDTAIYKELEGKKFRAPHRHQWGQVVYHNAMVCSVPEIPVDNDFEVRVLFLNPTQQDMQPCPYYFNLETNCYKEDQCKYSHGEVVPFSSLQDYIEPKYEHLSTGSAILAKKSDDLWHRAKIASISEGKCLVKFDSKNLKKEIFEEVVFSDILPLERSGGDSDEDSENGDSNVEEDIDDFEAQIENDLLEAKKRQEDLINLSLMKVPEKQPLGEWEQYTKGIGSKLMQKMGYIVGTGLGKRGAGIVKPVTAIILPQGKSLDYCMNLKEKCNNPDLFNADKLHKSRKKVDKKDRLLARAENRKNKKMKNVTRMSLVKFITYRFSLGNESFFSEEEVVKIMKDKLATALDKDLSIANFMVEEKLDKTEEATTKLKLDIQRLQQVHSNSGTLERKMFFKEADLKYLKAFKVIIKNETVRRKNNREMAVF